MSSVALEAWQEERASRIDELLDAHRSVGGVGRGRRWKTQQLNWSMILRLAGEFQGYARDLHDLAASEFVDRLGSGVPLADVIVSTVFTSGRKLDMGNAQPSSLGADFSRFGLQLWQEIGLYDPAGAPGWKSDLDALNKARNAIAHDDSAKMDELKLAGYNLNNISTFKAFRKCLNQLAPAMDWVMAEHLASVYGSNRPW